MSALTDADFDLPAFNIWDITTDDICMEVGTTSLQGIKDREAMAVLYKVRRITAARLKHIERELERLEALTELTTYTNKAMDEQMARTERWLKQDYPRLLDIALHKNGIQAL